MINLEHTIEEVNAILLALSKLPFEMVHELIAKIKDQAGPQVQALNQPAPAPAPEETPSA